METRKLSTRAQRRKTIPGMQKTRLILDVTGGVDRCYEVSRGKEECVSSKVWSRMKMKKRGRRKRGYYSQTQGVIGGAKKLRILSGVARWLFDLEPMLFAPCMPHDVIARVRFTLNSMSPRAICVIEWRSSFPSNPKRVISFCATSWTLAVMRRTTLERVGYRTRNGLGQIQAEQRSVLVSLPEDLLPFLRPAC